DGATVVRRMKLDAALRQIPCLLLTSSEDREDELRALEAGSDAFVRKGEEPGEILVRLAAILRSANLRAFGAGSSIETGSRARGLRPAAADAPASLLGPKKILAVDDSPTY